MEEKPRRIGLNAAGYDVYETSTGRVVQLEYGVDHEHEGKADGEQKQPPSWWLRAENLNDLMYCALGVAKAILNSEPFSGEKLTQLYRDFTSTTPLSWQKHLTLPYMLDIVEKRLRAEPAAIEKLRGWTRDITDQPTPAEGEDDPILFVGIEGVITSHGSWMLAKMEGRNERVAIDRVSIALLAALAGKIGAKLVLTSPWRYQWPGGTEVRQTLIAAGLRSELWHHDWMLPVLDGRTTWQELDAWAEVRGEFVGLIIDNANNKYAGALEVGDYYTHPVTGFDELDYFRILDELGIEDSDIDRPPPPAGLGFRSVPSKWAGSQQTAGPKPANSRPVF